MFYDITNLPRYLPSSHVVHTPREHNNLRHNPRIVIDCENATGMIMTQNPANFRQTIGLPSLGLLCLVSRVLYDLIARRVPINFRAAITPRGIKTTSTLGNSRNRAVKPKC